MPVGAPRVATKGNIQFIAFAEHPVSQVSQVTPKNLASPGSARVLLNLKKPGADGKDFVRIRTEKRTSQSLPRRVTRKLGSCDSMGFSKWSRLICRNIRQ